jgi:hypothetical protein
LASVYSVTYMPIIDLIQSASASSRGKAFLVILCGAVLVSAVWVTVWWYAPPLRLAHESKIRVDVSTLGEYPTTVTRIRLSNVNSRAVVWELAADNGEAQMHGFTLNEGENASGVDTDTESGHFTVVTPPRSASFVLRKGTEYRLEVWSGRSLLSKRSTVFHFSNQ